MKFINKLIPLAAALAFAASSPVLAAAPMAGTNAPGFFRIMLGDFEVTAISDGTVALPIEKFLHQPPAKTGQQLARAYESSPLENSVMSYLINTGSRLVLIDTGAGSLFGPTLGQMLANLKASGYQPEQVDEVLITHLHPDHVGGLVADGRVVFPNAIVRADQRDSDFWLSQANMDKASDKSFFQGATSSLAPYIANKHMQQFSGASEIVPGIRAVTSYGHTPGHINYMVESKGQKLLLVGDLIHNAIVQLPHPEVTIDFDADPKAAAATRKQVFTTVAKDGTMIGAAHMQFPGLGRLRSVGQGFEWLPVNYTQLH
ncbi:MBL fold metallo-hydrolase [Janthinobacterium agaricidamnosum]|uniref:Methyl parathion hydrolase n=1 Tax=Janthinobacterium agaricidamnosum NBRC 102515 = DSM 9628 TaxID=1349767 RepID=W0V7Q8_9BURK|nr:MBL fold metallo-hydrolase [Janthinobacterium agaricidamnosum]CDG83302.1 methyl parathion hydrolase [Janthinobacterium agaricidamnosum NBRC 102515 = DSM 9628]